MPRRADLVRRADLARAAFDVVRARGTQIPMRELAAALGIKRPTLYFYFPDLGAVFEAVLDPLYHALGQSVAARLRAHDHPIDRVRAVIDAALAFHRAQPPLGASVVLRWALGAREPAALLARERRGVAGARDALIADLRAGIARREVRPCEPERVVDVVLAFIAGAMIHHVLGIAHGDDATDELVQRVLEPLRARRKTRRIRP